MKNVFGQIQYINKDGDNVHSDLDGDPNDPEFRKFLHDNLDEWLDNFASQKRPLFCGPGGDAINIPWSSIFYVHRGARG